MDKKVIFAVAGSGKTTYIVNSLSKEKRTLIVTYTIANCENLKNKILNKFGGVWPTNLTVMTYFKFLYNFCYKPLLSDRVRARGITYECPQNYYNQKNNINFYLTSNNYFYSNRLSLFLLELEGVFSEIQERLTKYFDEFVTDEVQDIAGRDFNFLIKLMQVDINQLYVGDFFQHTYDTSRDGNVNKSLFDDQKKYCVIYTDISACRTDTRYLERMSKKKNTVKLMGKSTLRLWTEMASRGVPRVMGINPPDIVFCGGGFPILLKDGTLVGVIAVSGPGDEYEHDLIVRALEELMK